MTTLMKKASLIALILMLWTTTAFAHKSPDGCTGSGLGINLSTPKPQVHVGDVISYSAEVFNGLGSGPVVCDASGIQASVVTPDGQSHPITLTRTALSNGQIDFYPNVASYTVRTQDVGTLTATASDTGDIHQNSTDSRGGGNQGVNTTVLAAPPVVTTTPSPSVTPSPTSTGGTGRVTPPTVVTTQVYNNSYIGVPQPPSTPVVPPKIHIVKNPNAFILPPGGGKVIYTYTVTNRGTVAMSNVKVTDNKCTPVSFLAGDLNTNNLLDVSETWIYVCQANLAQTTTNMGTAEGHANGFTVIDASSATVVVPVIAATTLPGFPNTGYPPESE